MKFTINSNVLSFLVEACSKVEGAPLVLSAARDGVLHVGATFWRRDRLCGVVGHSDMNVMSTPGTAQVDLHAFRWAISTFPVGPVHVEKTTNGLRLYAPSGKRSYTFLATWGDVDFPRVDRATVVATMPAHELRWLLRATGPSMNGDGGHTLFQWWKNGMRATTIHDSGEHATTLAYDTIFGSSGWWWLGKQERDCVAQLCEASHKEATLSVGGDLCCVEVDGLKCFFVSPSADDEPLHRQVLEMLPRLMGEDTEGVQLYWSRFIDVVRGLCCSADGAEYVTLRLSKGALRVEAHHPVNPSVTALDEIEVKYDGPPRTVTLRAETLLSGISANGAIRHMSSFVYLGMKDAKTPVVLRSVPPYFARKLLKPVLSKAPRKARGRKA